MLVIAQRLQDLRVWLTAMLALRMYFGGVAMRGWALRSPARPSRSRLRSRGRDLRILKVGLAAANRRCGFVLTR